MIFGGICLLYFGEYENINSSKMLNVYNIIFSLCLLIIFFYSYLFLFFSIIINFCSIPLLTITKCFIVNCIPNKYKGSGVALIFLLGNIIDIVGSFFIKWAYKLNSNFIINILPIIFFLLKCLYNSYQKEIEINNGKEKELEDIEKV